MKKIAIRKLYQDKEKFLGTTLVLEGWVKTVRKSKQTTFVELNDGTFFNSIQVVFAHPDVIQKDEWKKVKTGASIIVQGTLTLSEHEKQVFELQGDSLEVIGTVSEDYPIQKKGHTREFLRTIPHLRPRTNTFMAVYRIRSLLEYALHTFFQSQDFVYVNAPILNASDCEGAGEQFYVTAFDLENVPKLRDGKVDYTKDFFGKSMKLTVSGQLDTESFAMAFGNVYSFGPVFRAENSNTPTHAAEFWMIEPEMAFAELDDAIEMAEKMVKYCIQYILDHAQPEMSFLNQYVDHTLIETLQQTLVESFERVSYTKAIELLKPYQEKFHYPVQWGLSLQTEHERFLTEKLFQKPIVVTDYPVGTTSFYMRLNPDKKTVAAMDVLLPRVGEVIGGSQREERYDLLYQRITDLHMKMDDYKEYLDTRKYGSVLHSGFGMGFDRFLMYVTGITNIRDVIPFPKTPKNG